MIASNQEARKCSDKKMEGDDGLRTMECLRGRLLAERHASKVAKEDAELMGNKLIELENKFRVETKLRNKAEKKLKFLKKKLESLKISPILEESEQSSSSENCAFSCGSYTSTSGSKEPVDQITNPVTSQNLYHNVADIAAPNQSHESSSIDENSSSQETAKSDMKHPSLENPSDKSSTRRDQDAKTDNYLSSSSLKASIMEMEINGRNESDSDDYIDNSLALVPMNLPAESTKRSREVKIVKTSVGEVLDALRHAREKIQNSMERRHVIRVGPVLNS